MFGLIAQVLEFFYSIVPNYAIAIAMLTLTVMIILTPLTLKGTRSMMMMQIVQPELKKLQAQYKDDRQKLNEEMMKFYKENSINPLSGCLPLLIQMPVFLVLYRVLHGLTQQAANGGFEPAYLDKGSELYQSLVGQTEMKAFGMDLASSASNAVSKGIVHALPYLILVIGVCLTSIVQQKQISGRNPAAQSNPQQQLLMKLGPIMITFFSLIVPAGLAVYFFVSNLYRVGQQELISRTIYRTPEAQRLKEIQAKQHADKQASGEKKGFFAQLLGDMPQAPERRPKGGKNGKNGASTKPTPEKPAGKNGAASNGGSTRPPAAASGRTTPPGSRSAASRKKKKRK
jgi:YidC/Oxa1 family membrane protein insertase